MALLRSIAKQGRSWDLEGWRSDWRGWAESAKPYLFGGRTGGGGKGPNQTKPTHSDSGVVDAAEFLARSISLIQKGTGFREAFRKAAGGRSFGRSITRGLEAVEKYAGQRPAKVAEEFGLGCDVAAAFPLR